MFHPGDVLSVVFLGFRGALAFAWHVFSGGLAGFGAAIAFTLAALSLSAFSFTTHAFAAFPFAAILLVQVVSGNG